MIIRPAPGAQERFLATSADIALYGGAAGCGKTFAMIMEPLRYASMAKFRAVFLRRTMPEVTGPGGLWDEASEIYPHLGAKSRQSPSHEFRFPSGMSVSFHHLQHEKDRFRWQGAQVELFLFDELTHFTAEQFWYLALSRSRSRSGIKPYIRASTNPSPDSWVSSLVSWWIDHNTGYPIAERSGVVRYFVRIGDALEWGATREELAERFPGVEPLSFTFVPATLADNPHVDPTYRSRLAAMGTVERERLLYGNWLIRDRVRHQVIVAERDVVEYHESTPEWDPAKRQTLSLFGAWDFGTSTSLLVCLLAVVERTVEPTIWVDLDLSWRGATWYDAGCEVRTAMEDYGGPREWQFADPTGKGKQYDQGDWLTALRSLGIPIVALMKTVDPKAAREGKKRWLPVNRTKWQERAIEQTQMMLDSGRLRVNRRCRGLWLAMDNWRRALRENLDLDDADMEHVRPRKDVYSHHCDALLYLVSGVLDHIRQEREEGREAPVDYGQVDPDAAVSAMLDDGPLAW